MHHLDSECHGDLLCVEGTSVDLGDIECLNEVRVEWSQFISSPYSDVSHWILRAGKSPRSDSSPHF